MRVGLVDTVKSGGLFRVGAALLVAATGCKKEDPCEVPGGSAERREQCQVYAAVTQHFGRSIAQTEVESATLRIPDRDEGEAEGKAMRRLCAIPSAHGSADEALVAQLCELSREPMSLDPLFSPTKRPKLVNIPAAKDANPGYYRFSRIAFSPSHDAALVFTGYHCGPTCGTGVLFLVSKKGGAWGSAEEVWHGWES